MPIMQNVRMANKKSIDIITLHEQILEREYGIKQLLLARTKRQ